MLEEEKLVDLVVGPDAYRDLPSAWWTRWKGGRKAVNTLLSREETYAEIQPVRLDDKGVTGFISIMRGCDNMCSFLRGALYPGAGAQPRPAEHCV